MTEDFLHYIWNFQRFNPHALHCVSGEPVEVIKSGVHNLDSGPDFFNSRLKIGDTEWAGNVEIHLRSSDWYKHGHQSDKVYDKVILHLVWEDDQPVKRANGDLIPTLELKGRVSKVVLDKYQTLSDSKLWVPCANEFSSVDDIYIKQQMDRMMVERLEQKSERIDRLLSLHVSDWEEVFYQLLCRYFGFKVNATPFELLSTTLPFSILRKHQNNQLQLEALLFGQAGFLNEDFKGDYPLQLQKEYQYLAKKYQLKAMDVSLWKFMRMRPSNFPTIRLAQLAALIHKHQKFFSPLIESKEVKQLSDFFKVKAFGYWNAHYRLDVPAARNHEKKLGKQSVQLLLINVVAPLLFNYGLKKGSENFKEKAIELLENLPAEKNTITKKWEALGAPLKNAFHSQALIQLKNNHCEFKKCLTCMLGNAIIKKE
jgi:hypothetical protein